MIYVFAVLAAVAIAFILLGALSVWVVVLSLALKVMLAASVAFVLYLIWNRFFGRKA